MSAYLATIVAAAAVAAATAQPVADVCSSESFTISERAVSVRVCAPAQPPRAQKGKPATVELRETVSSGGTSFAHSTTLDYLDGADANRTIDDVPLDRLGIQKSLHLTLAYGPNSIRIEHALLVPGAVPLK